MTSSMAMAQFSMLEARHGYQPMRLSQEPVLFTYGAYPVPKGAPWLEEFNVNLLRISDGGLVRRLIAKYVPPKYLIPQKQEGPPPRPFQIEHIMLITLVWMAGLAISGLALILEMLMHKEMVPI